LVGSAGFRLVLRDPLRCKLGEVAQLIMAKRINIDAT
jgi:hypothetical protein